MILGWRTDTLYFYDQDFKLWIARKHDNKWYLQDTIMDMGLSYIDTADINRDGYTDILATGIPQMNGHRPTIPILSRKDGSLCVREDCKLWNFAYVPERNVIRSSWEGSWYATKFKEEYHWVNDTLKLLAGVRLIPNTTRMDDTSNMSTLEYYRLQGDTVNVTKRILSDTNDAAYEKALWEGYGNP